MTHASLDSPENVSNPLSDEEVDSLVYIADAGVKERRGHWYTLGIPINHHYGLEDQLEAIRTLGESRNKKALKYLEKLAEAGNEMIHIGGHILHPNDPPEGENYYFKVFPNAKGQLCGSLKHEISLGYENSFRYKNDLDEFYRKLRDKNKHTPYGILQQAIETLKMSIPE
ncbi:MAG: hypothetical protein RL557_575 [archaeon]|jgi:hypothetical protein